MLQLIVIKVTGRQVRQAEPPIMGHFIEPFWQYKQFLKSDKRWEPVKLHIS